MRLLPAPRRGGALIWPRRCARQAQENAFLIDILGYFRPCPSDSFMTGSREGAQESINQILWQFGDGPTRDFRSSGVGAVSAVCATHFCARTNIAHACQGRSDVREGNVMGPMGVSAHHAAQKLPRRVGAILFTSRTAYAIERSCCATLRETTRPPKVPPLGRGKSRAIVWSRAD